MAASGCEWAHSLLRSAHEQFGDRHVPVPGRLALAPRAGAAQSYRAHLLGADAPARRAVAAPCAHLSSLSPEATWRPHLMQEPDAVIPLVRIRGGGYEQSSSLLRLGFPGDDVAVVGELADERVDLAQGERRRRVALEIAPDEAVVGDAELQGGRAAVLDDDGAVLLGEGEDAEDPAHARFPVAAMDRFAERADGRAGSGGAREERHRRRGRAVGLIVGVDRVTPASSTAMLAEQFTGGGSEKTDVVIVPLDGDLAPEPARRRGVVGTGDFHAAVEMDRPRPVLVVAKGLQRQREEMRLLLGEHGGDLALGGAVDAGVGPARLPAIEIRLSLLVEPLEAQALERRLLRVPDGRLDFALAIWIPDPTGQRHGAVVGEHIAVQWVERGIVDVRREHALLEVIEHDDADGAAETTKRLFVELRPAPGARVEGEQADALAAVAEGEDEQARAAVLPRDGVPDHRAVAVIDLPLLAGRGHDHRMRLEGALTTQPPHEAPHAGVPGWEPVLIDQVLPDRHGVAAATEGELDELAVGLAGARPGGPAGRRRPRRQPAEGRRPHAKVGGHLTGRFCWVGGNLTGPVWRRPPAGGAPG